MLSFILSLNRVEKWSSKDPPLHYQGKYETK